jgi:ribosomal protein L15E
MTKHLADHRTASTGARLKQFVMLDKYHAQISAPPIFAKISDRSDDQGDSRRLIEYLRIERGRMT